MAVGTPTFKSDCCPVAVRFSRLSNTTVVKQGRGLFQFHVPSREEGDVAAPLSLAAPGSRILGLHPTDCRSFVPRAP